MGFTRFIARPLLAANFIVSGVARIKDSSQTAEQLEPTINRVAGLVPAAKSLEGHERTVALAVGGTQVGAGILLALGKLPRLAAGLLSVTALLTTIVEFKNADAATSGAKSRRLSQLVKNISLTGGVLLAAADTDGKPSVAWRAQHAVSDSKKKLSKQAKQAQKHAQKRLGEGEQALKDTLSR